MTTITTSTGALEAMLAHHAALLDGVSRRIETLSSSVASGGRYEPFAADLVTYLAEEVLPHAAAEEQTIYPAAEARRKLTDAVAGMVEEHRRLAASIERLATAGDADAATGEAAAIGSLFAAHVAKENELVLPPLATDDAVDLAGLLVEMHRLIEAAQTEASIAEDAVGGDIESSLVALLLDAARELTGAGKGEPACRLIASAWATLRAARPDLGVRLTAALHGLARSVGAEPVTFSARRPALSPELDHELDVRTLAPARRHEEIFATYDALVPGASFVLVNDHDPKPLRYQFDAEHAGDFSWDYLEAGPRTWRVRIGRKPATTGAAR